MDYIYGKLNNKIKAVDYNGIDSNTADITIDNSDREHRTIKVDVIKTPGTLTINNTNGESVSFNGSQDKDITIDSPTTEQYQELVNKVNDLDNKKLDKATDITNKNRVYGRAGTTTNEVMFELDESTTKPWSIPFRNSTGNIISPAPQNDDDLANKSYIDNKNEFKAPFTIGTRGYGTIGNNSICIGAYSTAQDSNDIAIGRSNTVNGPYAIAIGADNNVIGKYSIASGYGVKAIGDYQYNVGKYNDNKEHTIFEIGNGTSDTERSNALEVYKDGHIEAQTQGTTDNSLTLKSYVDTKVSKSGDTITGNLIITGNLSVSGTTTTVDTETLKVKDNVIVTNSDKKELIDLSGLAINTDATNTFGIMYNPTSNTVDLGLGTITTEGKFTFNENEGLPLAIRDANNTFTQDHLISWSDTKNKLVDSGIDKSKVAQTDKENTFTKKQILNSGLQLGSVNITEYDIDGTKDLISFNYANKSTKLMLKDNYDGYIATSDNLSKINGQSLVGEYGNKATDISIPVVSANDNSAVSSTSQLKSITINQDGKSTRYSIPTYRMIHREHITIPATEKKLLITGIAAQGGLAKLFDVDMGYNWQYDMDSIDLSELFEKDCGKIEILNPDSTGMIRIQGAENGQHGSASPWLSVVYATRFIIWGRKKTLGSSDTESTEIWDLYLEISGNAQFFHINSSVTHEELI